MLKYAVASGNWSDPLIWNDGTLPVTGDAVHANGMTVVIDQDITCERISTAASTPAVVGGTFRVETIPAEGRTLACDIYTGNGTGLDVYASGQLTVGDVYGGPNAFHAVNLNLGFFVDLTAGNVTAGTNGSSAGIVLRNTSSVTCLDVTGLGNTGVIMFQDEEHPTEVGRIICRDVFGAGGNYAGGRGIHILGGNASITCRDVVGSRSEGINVSSYGGVTVECTSVSTVGLSVGLNVVYDPAIIDVAGPVTASTTAYGIAAATAWLRVKGPVTYASNGRAPIFAPIWELYDNTPTALVIPDTTGNLVTFSNMHGGLLPSDVRAGITYGTDEGLVGTVPVPDPRSVSTSVGGQAVLTPADVAQAVGSSMTTTLGG